MIHRIYNTVGHITKSCIIVNVIFTFNFLFATNTGNFESVR